MYVYINSESGLWTVGFYSNDEFQSESDWKDMSKAGQRVAFLNGSSVSFSQEIINGEEE